MLLLELFWGAKPTKAPRGDGAGLNESILLASCNLKNGSGVLFHALYTYQ